MSGNQSFKSIQLLNASNWATKLKAAAAGVSNYVATFQAATGTVAYQEDCLNGWMPTGDTLTFASVDGPTQTVTISGDKTATYFYKQKLKYAQSHAFTYRFPFNSNSTDAVGGSVTGTDTAITWGAALVEGSGSASFNGTTSNIAYTDSSAWKPTSQFTVIASIATTTAAGTVTGIIQSYSANTNVAGWAIFVGVDAKARVALGDNTAALGYIHLVGNTVINTGATFTIAVTYRNGYAQLYVNGNLEATGYLQVAYATTNYVRVGCINVAGTNANFFNGRIDNLLFMNNYALDAATIKSLAAHTSNTVNVTKYAVISAAPVYSASVTTLTLYSGNDFSFENTAIIASSAKINQVTQPLDFPSNKEKWTYTVKYYVTGTQNPAIAGTVYALGNMNFAVPIGSWRVKASATFWAVQTGTTSYFMVGLSRSGTTLQGDSSQYVGLASPVAGLDVRAVNIAFCTELSKKTTFTLIALARDTSTAAISLGCNYPNSPNYVPPIILEAEFQF
jgi:hypothetical protein